MESLVMNILTLNYEYPPLGGGASTVAKTISEALIKKGHTLTVITMGYRGFQRNENVNGVEIIRLPCWRTKKFICYPWEQLTYIIASICFLRKFLKINSFDVCHTHFIIPTGVIALWVKKYFNLPYIITAHGSDVPGYSKRFNLLHKFLQLPWQKICAEAHSIISPSSYLYDLISKKHTVKNCIVLPNGTDINLYRNGPKENIILLLSRLHYFKGIQKLIHAFSQIQHSGWTIHIAGDGPYRKELEALVNFLDLNDRVFFHGYLENKSEKHIELLSKAKIFVLASEFENSPVSVMEAIASDCHVILSDIPAHQSFKRYGAMLFSKDDISALTGILQQAMILPVTTSPFKDELSINKMTNDLEKILNLQN
jgi:glycosyltransferase involved in cell wall biosynthesis